MPPSDGLRLPSTPYPHVPVASRDRTTFTTAHALRGSLMLELTPIRSQTSLKWDAKAAAHLLSRAGLGGMPKEIKRLAALPLEKAVDTLLEEACAAGPPPRPSWLRDA